MQLSCTYILTEISEFVNKKTPAEASSRLDGYIATAARCRAQLFLPVAI